MDFSNERKSKIVRKKVNMMNTSQGRCIISIDKEIDIPDWNLLCLRRITADHVNNFLFVYIFGEWKNKMIQPYLPKFCRAHRTYKVFLLLQPLLRWKWNVIRAYLMPYLWLWCISILVFMCALIFVHSIFLHNQQK